MRGTQFIQAEYIATADIAAEGDKLRAALSPDLPFKYVYAFIEAETDTPAHFVEGELVFLANNVPVCILPLGVADDSGLYLDKALVSAIPAGEASRDGIKVTFKRRDFNGSFEALLNPQSIFAEADLVRFNLKAVRGSVQAIRVFFLIKESAVPL